MSNNNKYSPNDEFEYVKKQPKLVVLGLSRAGKTSIFNKFFLKSSIDELKRLRPTMLFSLSAPFVERLKSQITVYDLGGQKEFIQQNIANKEIYENAQAIIYVVDVQAPERINEVKLYLRKIEEVLQKLESQVKPEFFVFLHKYDPEKRSETFVYQSIINYMNNINEIMGERSPMYYFTSIFDFTITKAMIQVLFLSTPELIISELNMFEIKAAYKIILKNFIEKTGISSFGSQSEKINLRKFAAKFGSYYIKSRQLDWEEDDFSNTDTKTNREIQRTDNIYSVRATKLIDKNLKVSFTCPFKNNIPDGIEDPRILCEISQGIIEGIATTLGYKIVLREATYFEDGTSRCAFSLN